LSLAGRGVAPGRPADIGSAVTGDHVGHTVTDRLDHAGTLDTDAAGKRERVNSRPMIDVDIVDAHGLLAKPDFSGTGLGELFLRPFQDIGRADA
jgi:hypothetical protein